MGLIACKQKVLYKSQTRILYHTYQQSLTTLLISGKLSGSSGIMASFVEFPE